MENAIWTTFYDIPDEGRSDYLRWLHEEYVPGLLSSSGYLWAAHYEAIPKGEGFLSIEDHLARSGALPIPVKRGYALLIGGESTRVFFDPSPRQREKGYDSKTSRTIAERISPVSYIHTVEWSVAGPEFKGEDSMVPPAPVIQMGCFDTTDRDEDVAAWYAQERMVLVSRTPGCISGRKLLAVLGGQRHGVLYGFASREQREKNFIHVEKTEWTARIHKFLVHPKGSPFVGRLIWPLTTAAR